jgi:hypothetical protein
LEQLSAAQEVGIYEEGVERNKMAHVLVTTQQSPVATAPADLAMQLIFLILALVTFTPS